MFRELSDEEGVRHVAYRCPAGHLTVGVGHNLDADPASEILRRKLRLGEAATGREVQALFDKDVGKVVDQLNKRLPWFQNLSAARQYVLISMGFNMGVPGLMKFKNTLAALARGDIPSTIYGMRSSRWYRQVGKRGPKLIRIMDTNFI